MENTTLNKKLLFIGITIVLILLALTGGYVMRHKAQPVVWKDYTQKQYGIHFQYRRYQDLRWH